jgi:hypothetical protein
MIGTFYSRFRPESAAAQELQWGVIAWPEIREGLWKLGFSRSAGPKRAPEQPDGLCLLRELRIEFINQLVRSVQVNELIFAQETLKNYCCRVPALVIAQGG